MGQAQELQQKMADVQTRLETLEVEGEAGAGMVRAVCTGKGAV
ncbi:MAG: YbaB/EbfC family nucleoid-associated protein, partial [Pseudomonadota bacterium]